MQSAQTLGQDRPIITYETTTEKSRSESGMSSDCKMQVIKAYHSDCGVHGQSQINKNPASDLTRNLSKGRHKIRV